MKISNATRHVFAGAMFSAAILAVQSPSVAANETESNATAIAGADSDPLPNHALWVNGEDRVGCNAACPVHGAAAYDFGITGDWWGGRRDLADNGITANGDITSFYYGVASGGRQQQFRFGGHGDYVFNFDGGKLGIQEGLFLKVRAEHRFADSINRSTGAVMPATVLTDLPVADSDDLYVTNFVITQALSEQFAVFVGKIDSLDGDVNAYAHGRGKTQFSNMAMIANPVLLRTVPYSSLAVGFSVLDAGQPIFTFTAMNPTDTTSTTGINQWYEDGVTLTAEGRLPTRFLGKQGHHLFGGAWSSKTYTSLGQDPRIITGQVPIAQTEGSWALYYNFDQELVSDRCNPGRGWGVFGRAAIGDDATNPLNYFLSLGLGGASPLHGRSQDQFGVGWYYIGASDKLGPLLGNFGDGQGVELFYNYQLSRNVAITPDLQVIEPGHSAVDTALGVGVRASIRL